MKKALATGIGLLAAALASIVLPLAGGHVHAATGSVTVADVFFADASSGSSTTTITAGDTVIWTWSGSAPHSVTADDPASFDDPPGSWKISGTFSYTFNTPGSYAYYCRLHGAPGGVGMSGTVVVQAAPATNTPTSTPTATSTPAATNTPGPTNTPDTTIPARTATGTPLTPAPTDTPAPSITAAAATPAVGGALPATTATRPSDGTGANTRLPRTGDGAAGDTPAPWLSIALAAAGLATIVGAFVMRKRAWPRAADTNRHASSRGFRHKH